MVNGLILMGRHWKDGYGGVTGKSLLYGDISFKNGGRMRPHATHRIGKQVDPKPITKSGGAGSTSVGRSSYSLAYNLKYARLQRAVWSVKSMLHNNKKIPGCKFYRGHANHYHTTIY